MTYWIRAQTETKEGKFSGYGRVVMKIKGSTYIIEVEDEFLLSIVTNSIENLKIDASVICSKLKKMGIRDSKRIQTKTNLLETDWPKISTTDDDDQLAAKIDKVQRLSLEHDIKPWHRKRRKDFEEEGIKIINTGETAFSLDVRREQIVISTDLAAIVIDQESKFLIEAPPFCIRMKPFHKINLMALNRNSETVFYQSSCYNVDSRSYTFSPGTLFSNEMHKLILSNSVISEDVQYNIFLQKY